MRPRPPFNSFPHQHQQNGFQSNSAMGNQRNNNMNMPMMQPQMGIFNTQPPIPPNNNSNFNNNNYNARYMNGTNQQFPAQNNNLGFSQSGPIFPNLNNLSVFQQQQQLPVQFNNPSHNQNQPDWLNLPQQQQLLLQTVSQLLNGQLPDLSQFVTGGQAMGCHNPAVVPNRNFGFMQQNQMQQQANQGQKNSGDVNASNLPSAAASQVQGDPSFRRPMGGHGNNGQNTNNFPGRNAKRDSKWGSQNSKFQQPRFHQADNANRAFNGDKKKGPDNEWATKFPDSNSANPAKEERRSLALTYTEQEIKKWREDRKKFYPSKANIMKKLSGNIADSDVAKLRSEQLKEILTKQAELGVEVAEIPSHYLSGSDRRVNGRRENFRPSNKRGGFGTRYDKRGRSNKSGRFSKKPRSMTEESLDDTSFNKRGPTLLQKLLSADIRKDKSRLLQVLRFMSLNSFFKDWPEKPLRFPVVIVKDGVADSEIVQEKPLVCVEDNIEVRNKAMPQSIGDAAGDDDIVNDNGDDDDDDEKHDTQVDDVVLRVREKGTEIVRNGEEEEEEIID